MKKFLALVLALSLIFTSVSAVDISPLFSNSELNYTTEYTLSVSFDNAENIVNLLRELGVTDEIERYIDLESILNSISNADEKMKLEADMSSDFKRIKLALTSESSGKIVFNPNLSIGMNTKNGMWMHIDLNAAKPVYKIIYLTPFQNKYAVMDIFELMSENDVQEIIKTLENFLSKEYIDSFSAFASEIYSKYANVSFNGVTYTIKLDNDGLIGMMKEFIPFIEESIGNTPPENEALNGFGDIEIDPVLAMIDSLEILGEDGITITCSLLSGKLNRMDATADFSINIEEFFSSAIGMEWPYKNEGKLDFTFKYSAKMSKYGKTTPSFPTLTDENSFTVEQDIVVETEEYVPEYPHYYVSASADRLICENGEYYVPLRGLLEDAYDDTVSITYSNGTVTATCDYFPGFKSFMLTNNSTAAYFDGKLRYVPKVIMQDGTTYVSYSFFKNTFNWELSEIYHDVLEGTYTFSFHTDVEW